MTTEKRLRPLCTKVAEQGSDTAKEAVQVLWTDYKNDSWIEALVNDLLAPNATQQERLWTLCNLLGAYGVGTIVEGRLQ